jgi:hypothetical protein
MSFLNNYLFVRNANDYLAVRIYVDLDASFAFFEIFAVHLQSTGEMVNLLIGRSSQPLVVIEPLYIFSINEYVNVFKKVFCFRPSQLLKPETGKDDHVQLRARQPDGFQEAKDAGGLQERFPAADGDTGDLWISGDRLCDLPDWEEMIFSDGDAVRSKAAFAMKGASLYPDDETTSRTQFCGSRFA